MLVVRLVECQFGARTDKQRREIRTILCKLLGMVMEQIEEDILFEINKPKRIWERKWISRRPTLGGSALLLKELAIKI